MTQPDIRRTVTVIPTGRPSSAGRRPIRALHVVPSLSLGGAPRSALELIEALEATGRCDVRLCVLDHSIDHEALQRLNHPATFLGCPVHERTWTGRRWWRLRDVVGRLRPDVVHAHLWPTFIPARLATMGTNTKLLAHIRDTPLSLVADSSRAAWRRWQYRRFVATGGTRFIAVSEAAKQYSVTTTGIDPTQIDVVLNGINLAPLSRSRRTVPTHTVRPAERGEPFTMGCAGRFVVEKGQRHLIEAVRQLHEAGHDIRLKLAGSGSLEESYRAQIAACGLTACTEFVGVIDDMPGFYDSLDVLVLPSIAAEGLPRVVMEAMAVGCPVVATETSGVREAIVSPQHGWVVPIGDATALANALTECLSDPVARHSRVDHAQRRAVEAFSVERVADEVLERYADLTAKR